MPMTAAEILESARQLPPGDRQSLLMGLLDEEEAEWRKELGELEPGHSEWFAGRIRKSLEDERSGMSTEQAMSRARAAIRSSSGMKQSA